MTPTSLVRTTLVASLVALAAPARAQSWQAGALLPPPPPISAAAAAGEASRAVETDGPAALGTRLRLGLGVSWSPPLAMVVRSIDSAEGSDQVVGFALTLRLGAQLNDYFAVYYQPAVTIANTMHVSLFSSSKPENYWIPVHASSAVVELTLWKVLQLAAGPSVFVGAFGKDPIGSDYVGAGGTARLDVVVNGRKPSAKMRTSIGLQAQAAFFGDGGRYTDLALVVGFETL